MICLILKNVSLKNEIPAIMIKALELTHLDALSL
jgi:hypothetical protein